MALQAYGGPDITTFRIPVDGQSNKVGANLGVTLSYAIKNGGFSGGYTHGLTGGSGALTGSTVDQVNFAANRGLTRLWSGQFNLGYAHNKAVVNSTQAAFPTYNTWTIGGGVSRPFGPNASFAIAYNANINDYAQSGCSDSSCSSSQTYNYITISYQWYTRPFILP